MRCPHCGAVTGARVNPKGRGKRLSLEAALQRVKTVYAARTAGRRWKDIAIELDLSDAGLFNWMASNSYTDLEGMAADIAERETSIAAEIRRMA